MSSVFNEGRANGRLRRSKREEMKVNAPKPSKRAALGTITNLAERVQPHRNAKSSQATSKGLSQNQIQNDENAVPRPAAKSFQQASKQPFTIHVDTVHQQETKTIPELPKEPVLSSAVTALSRCPLSNITDQVMAPCEDSLMVTSEDDCVVISSGEIDRLTNTSGKLLAVDSEFGGAEYAQDIHKYMKASEKKNRPKPGYMKKQTDINENMRMILIDWLVEVGEEYKLTPQTLYLTVNYIDRFLSVMSVLRGNLQLVGTACMLVASKFEEIYPPEVSEFVYITDDTYTPKQVLRMEHLILKALNFDISVPTVLNFAERYITVVCESKGTKLEYLVRYLCELTMLESCTYLQYLPSVIAASAVSVALHTLGQEFWTPSLSYFSDFQLEDIQSCMLDMHKTFTNAPKLAQQSIREKYSSVRFQQVGQLLPPTALPL